jgi:hypothetical protein
MVTTRKQIHDPIEAYARAIRDRDSKAVSELFAVYFDHRVHGVGNDSENPWNTKRETDREGVRKIYEDFFSHAGDMEVEYTDRAIDADNNSAAMVVRVRSGSASMENALHIKWNNQGEIIFFYNWYGQSPDQGASVRTHCIT